MKKIIILDCGPSLEAVSKKYGHSPEWIMTVLKDTDSNFQTEIIPVTKWVARRLGHPIMQLEFNSGSIYACYEEAISEYSLHINHYNMKNWRV